MPVAHRVHYSIAIAIGALIAFAHPATAHGYKRKNIQIVHPWTPAKPDSKVSETIVIMTIKNIGSAADRLRAVESPQAARIQIYESSDKLSRRGLAIPPGKDLAMTHEGPHLRLIGIKKELTPYDTIPAKLIFEKAGRINIDILVDELSAPNAHPEPRK
jgi:copper(I)-binding protein